MQFKIEVEQEVDGRWIAEVMDIPGVLVYGEDKAHAVAKAKALALRVLADWVEDDQPYDDPAAKRNPWLDTAGLFADDATLEPMLGRIYADRAAERLVE